MDLVSVSLPKDVKINNKTMKATPAAARELIELLTRAVEVSTSRLQQNYLTRDGLYEFAERSLGTGTAARKVAGRVFTHLLSSTLEGRVPLKITCTKCGSLINERLQCKGSRNDHTSFSDYHQQYHIDLDSLRKSADKIRRLRSPGPETKQLLQNLLQQIK